MVSENILAMDDSINKNKDLFINLLKGKIKKNDLIWLRASELEQETKDWAFKLLRDNMRDMYVKVGDHGLLSVQGGGAAILACTSQVLFMKICNPLMDKSLLLQFLPII